MLVNKKKIILYSLSFLIPFGLLMIYFMSQNTSFDKLLISDSNEQYIYLFRYLKEALLGNESLLYSFSKGIGGSMIGTFFYYLACPFNLLVVLISDSMIPTFIGILSFFKIGLSGITMFYYLMKHNKNSSILNLAFATGYSLMSYNIIYYFNIMWLDVVYLTPIIIHGLDQILENKTSKTYTIFFTISIFINYYMSYMLAIFIGIYFLYRIVTKYNCKKDKKVILKIIKKFMIHTFLSLLIASAVLFPVIKELSASARDPFFYSRTGIVAGTLNMISQLGVHLQTVKVLYAIPYLFCGFLPIVVLLSYFTSKKKDKDKLYILIVILFFVLSLLLKPLILLWHGFSPPVLFSFRFTFLLAFFLIVIASEKFDITPTISIKKSILLTVVYIFLIAIGSYFGDVVYNPVINLINAFFLIATFLIYRICKQFPIRKYYISILVLVLLQCIVLVKFNFVTNKNLKDKQKSEPYITEIKKLQEYIDTENNDFNRVSGEFVWKENELFGSSTSKMGSFLSSVDGNVLSFLNNTGYLAISSDIRDNPDNRIMNSLLGVKYYYNIACDDDMSNISVEVIGNKKINLCKQDNALAIGYMIQNKKADDTKTDNIFEYQNFITETISGEKIYQKERLKKETDKRYIVLDDIEELYVWIKDFNEVQADILLNGRVIKKNYSTFKGMIRITNVKKGDVIGFSTMIKTATPHFYSVDIAKWNNSISELGENKIAIHSLNKNKMEFHINNNSDWTTLLLTIPYDDSFKVWMDGEKVDINPIFNTFIQIKVPKGQHTIKLEYKSFSLYIGLAVSLMGIIASILYFRSRATVKNCQNN